MTRFRPLSLVFAATAALPLAAVGDSAADDPPGVEVGTFRQQVATRWGADHGLPRAPVTAVAAGPGGELWVGAVGGLARLRGDRFEPVEGVGPVEALVALDAAIVAVADGALIRVDPRGRIERVATVPPSAGAVSGLAARDGALWLATDRGLYEVDGDGAVRRDAGLDGLLAGGVRIVRSVAVAPSGAIAVAARVGLFVREAGDPAWRRVLPRDGVRRWAPDDVRAVAWDARSRLAFASPQGVGIRDHDGAWRLFGVAEGAIPYADFTAATFAADRALWLGTRIGAIRFDGRSWEYRQGPRWLPDDRVGSIAPAGDDGDVVLATSTGVSRIALVPMTLAEKARRFEAAIDRRHRRTPYGFVGAARLRAPGDLTWWRNGDSDNDGLWTAMYGAGECFAYAATRDPAAKRRARAVFEALRFLGTVTQGGSHPAPSGFVARTILPTDGPDPNAGRLERDRRKREEEDALWKVIDPRWPTSADGRWFWKADTSSDELDGHFFFYARYHDLVAETPAEKREVADVVRAITDHLIANRFSLIDHDGKPTRWANYGPHLLNHDPDWWEERGLNSLSILSYLAIAAHVTGDARYRREADRLIDEHGYALNVLYPKAQSGPGSGNQSDDEMAFMGLYDLCVFETDPARRRMWSYAFHRYWLRERPERNPLFDFLYAGACREAEWRDAWGRLDLSPQGDWLEESVDTLRRYPLDRIDWPVKNSHRLDIVPLPPSARPGEERPVGSLRDGRVLPIDERFVEHWNHDPWRLDQGGRGQKLADGASFLLPYWLGRHHGFIRD